MDSIVYHLPPSTLHKTQNLSFGWIGLFTYIFKMTFIKWIALSITYPLQHFTRHKCRVGRLDKLSSFEFFFWSSFSFLFTPIALFAAWYSLVSYPEAPTSPGFPTLCTGNLYRVWGGEMRELPQVENTWHVSHSTNCYFLSNYKLQVTFTNCM